MNFFKRGMLSIVRKPIKTGILFLIIFIMGTVLASTLAIKDSIKETKKAIHNAVEPVATIKIDQEEIKKDIEVYGEEKVWESIKHPDISIIQSIGELEDVKYYDYNLKHSYLLARELQDGMVLPYIGEYKDINSYPQVGPITIYGVNVPDILAIQEDVIILQEGRTLTQEEVDEGEPVVVIGEKFAKQNNLQVGSTLKTQNVIYDYRNMSEGADMPTVYDTVLMDLEVVGIFTISEKTQAKQEGATISDEHLELENTIYTTNKYVEKVDKDATNKSWELYTEEERAMLSTYETMYTPTYILKDVTKFEDFKRKATPLLPKYYKIVDTADAYSVIKTPLEELEEIVDIVLLVTIAISILLVGIVITLVLYTRRHEICVYISLGEKKRKVISQILIEIAVITIVALSISLFVGDAIRDISKDRLLEGVETGIFHNNNYQYYGFGEFASGEPVLSSQIIREYYQVDINGNTMALFYGVSITTIAIATIGPMLYIAWLEPKKVAMKSINKIREGTEDEFF